MRKIFIINLFIFSVFFTALDIHTLHANTESDLSLRYYVGGKLGYSMLMVDNIKNLTVGKNNLKYSENLSSIPIGVMAGIQYTFTPLFAMRGELEYLYRLEVKSNKNMEFNQYVSTSILTPPTLESVTGNVNLSLNVHTILANIYIDTLLSEKVIIYTGIGVGFALVEAETDVMDRVFDPYDDIYPDSDSEKRSINLAFQVGLGTRIAITKNIFADINARYINMGSLPAFGSSELLRIEAKTIHVAEILFSVGYMF